MKKLTLLLIILLSWLHYSLLLGKNGLQDYIRIHKDIIIQKKINEKLKERNNYLFMEINDLNENPEALEERARNELGMIKSGEIFYRLVSTKCNYCTISYKKIMYKNNI
ncbi:Cell division protein FtsB [Serratia symbiotica]|nr:Cell division protein FtsB [Serratia symbiotica]